jgi:alpha-N-acetylglucosaminidase
MTKKTVKNLGNIQFLYFNSFFAAMPATLPEIDETLESADRFRYHENVCVLSYTMSFWQWADWERHIDWMALNGINMPLAFTGQEEIWRRVYKKVHTVELQDTHIIFPTRGH